MLLSLFCGAGGLDLGFEQAGFDIGLAFDKNADSVASHNHNRAVKNAYCRDVNDITLKMLDELFGARFAPDGVIGGPPCQSFSQANRSITDSDPRHLLPLVYAKLLGALNKRSPVKFFVMENVKGLRSGTHSHRLALFKKSLSDAGFHVSEHMLNATDFGVPQNRQRLFLVGVNRRLFGKVDWSAPDTITQKPENVTVKSAIWGLPEPLHFSRSSALVTCEHHVNHWCMTPKSAKFADGSLKPGDTSHRSFKTLAWDRPSITVAYGHREVHVHPSGKRRLSVYEGMCLQGFPHSYELTGSLSSQIDQVSEAVPPPMAKAVGQSVAELIIRLERRTAA